MPNLKFDENGSLISQKVNYTIKHDETDEELVDNYIKNECNFKIEYNKEGKTEFTEKEKDQE